MRLGRLGFLVGGVESEIRRLAREAGSYVVSDEEVVPL